MRTVWELPGWVWILIFAIIVIVTIFLIGCASPQKKIDPTVLPANTQEKLYKWQEMYKSVADQFGWLLPVLVLGSVAGVIITFKKPDFGIPLIVGCGYGISVLMAIAFKPEWVAYIGIFGGVGLAVAIVGYRLYKVGFKEVVEGGEEYKERIKTFPEIAGSRIANFNNAHTDTQKHKSTTKLVKKFKKKLVKIKEKMRDEN